MRRIRLSSLAEADIAGILRWTEDEFGASARLRYEALIAAALRDLAEDPYRPGAHERPAIGEGLMSYHLQFSRRQVAEATGRVRRPRHLLLYRVHGDSLLAIGRVLHDAMELARHLPEGDGEDLE